MIYLVLTIFCFSLLQACSNTLNSSVINQKKKECGCIGACKQWGLHSFGKYRYCETEGSGCGPEKDLRWKYCGNSVENNDATLAYQKQQKNKYEMIQLMDAINNINKVDTTYYDPKKNKKELKELSQILKKIGERRDAKTFLREIIGLYGISECKEGNELHKNFNINGIFIKKKDNIIFSEIIQNTKYQHPDFSVHLLQNGLAEGTQNTCIDKTKYTSFKKLAKSCAKDKKCKGFTISKDKQGKILGCKKDSCWSQYDPDFIFYKKKRKVSKKKKCGAAWCCDLNDDSTCTGSCSKNTS